MYTVKPMTYWIDLFTGITWQEFLDAGANISGFSENQRKIADIIKPSDILLCYLTGVMRWVGALEVIGPSDDARPIWKDSDYPIRLKVQPLVLLSPDNGVTMDQLAGRVTFYQGPSDAGLYKGMVRRSLRRFKQTEDGDLIRDLLVDAAKHPKALSLFEVEHQEGKKKKIIEVTVPDPIKPPPVLPPPEETSTRHTEIQYHLLKLGAEMGLDIWVARNDRSRVWNEKPLGQLPHMLDKLPICFNEATQRTIELIDVLWLKHNTIVAAFEVECTTSIYSGLLRMSDLLALQPNLDIKLYLVAPDERRDKVEQEIQRPTFQLRSKPLREVCGFLAFSQFMNKVEGIRKLGIVTSLRPHFLEETAEYFGRSSQAATTSSS